ncbi:MAG: VOC family protein [Acidobacteria bacterium]|nr:VOC family protein [Acidobacteriota bacterium]MBI3424103.1 VOC family protein [Acidobacteriota bacterium]
MKGPLLLLIVVGYIAVAVYSVGKTGSSKASLKTSVAPASASLNRVTLATNNMAAMVRFYNEVFGAGLESAPPSGASTTACQQGNLAGINLLLCPNQSARVKAPQNRHQLRFAVTDIEAAVQTVQTAGGKVDGKVTERHGEKLIAVRDLDGNTIEFTQTSK